MSEPTTRSRVMANVDDALGQGLGWGMLASGINPVPSWVFPGLLLVPTGGVPDDPPPFVGLCAGCCGGGAGCSSGDRVGPTEAFCGEGSERFFFAGAGFVGAECCFAGVRLRFVVAGPRRSVGQDATASKAPRTPATISVTTIPRRGAVRRRNWARE